MICFLIFFFPISSITIIARIESHLVHTKEAPAIGRPIRYIMFGHLPTSYCMSNNHVPPIKQMMMSIRTTSVTFARARYYRYYYNFSFPSVTRKARTRYDGGDCRDGIVYLLCLLLYYLLSIIRCFTRVPLRCAGSLTVSEGPECS